MLDDKPYVERIIAPSSEVTQQIMSGFRWDQRRCLLTLILAGLNTAMGGCVAMNIPSVRYADPSDRGGLLGPQRPANQAELSAGNCETGACDPFIGNCAGANGQAAEEPPVPEVPWPRFHPLPTRPVFMPSMSDSF